MKCEICIPITAETVEGALNDIKKAEKASDLVELRIDCIKNIDRGKLKKLLEAKKRKMIVACRPKSLGGNFEGKEEDRINLLKKAVELGADFVDI